MIGFRVFSHSKIFAKGVLSKRPASLMSKSFTSTFGLMNGRYISYSLPTFAEGKSSWTSKYEKAKGKPQQQRQSQKQEPAELKSSPYDPEVDSILAVMKETPKEREDIISQMELLGELFAKKGVPEQDTETFIVALILQLKYSKYIAGFLVFVNRNHGANGLIPAIKRFEERLNAPIPLEVKITSARPLDADAKQKLQSRFSPEKYKNAQFKYFVDPSIIDGYQIIIGNSRLIDMTDRTLYNNILDAFKTIKDNDEKVAQQLLAQESKRQVESPFAELLRAYE